MLLVIPGVMVVYVVFLVGVRFIARGRRMRAIPAVDLLRKDTRAPVLFLRSFEDDDLIDPTPRMVPMGDLFQQRYEEWLSNPLYAIGPVISIGRPGDKLALLGGARLFVPDHAWQSAIEYLRERAAAVILMVGRTEGVWWVTPLDPVSTVGATPLLFSVCRERQVAAWCLAELFLLQSGSNALVNESLPPHGDGAAGALRSVP